MTIASLNKEAELRVLNKELGDWIAKDNAQFVQDKNIFDHGYFGFMWQVCGFVPTTIECTADMAHDDINIYYLQVKMEWIYILICTWYIIVQLFI